jgi:predicted acyl esterase
MLIVLCVFVTLRASAQTVQPKSESDIPPNFSQITDAFDYTRQEAMIPMRDGVKLYTVILTPKGHTTPLPIILTRTPYSAKTRTTRASSPRMAAILGFVDMAFAESDYILVSQDVRGIHKSEGLFNLFLCFNNGYVFSGGGSSIQDGSTGINGRREQFS